MTILTKAGSCEPSVRYPLTVTDGKVSGAAEVSGSIGRQGIVKVSIRGAYANGQLNGNAGSGKWNGESAGIPCSGRWEASRQLGSIATVTTNVKLGSRSPWHEALSHASSVLTAARPTGKPS